MSLAPVLRSVWIPLAALALGGSVAGQTTWYIDAAATPPGNGTLASPYASIQYAIDQPSTLDGDVLVAAPGEYVEEVFLGKGVTLRSSAGPLVTILRAPSAGTVVGMGSFGGGVPRLEGFSVVGHPSAATSGIRIDAGFVTQCIVRDHKALGTAFGGWGIDAASMWNGGVSRCTVVSNQVGIEGPGIGTCSVGSSILYGNVSSDGVAIDPSYCLWGKASGISGPSNLVGDPLLWDLPAGDVHLGPLSACIDSGHPGLPPDPDGSPADRGAVSFDAAYLPAIEVYCTAKVNAQGCGASIGASGGSAASMSSLAPFHVTCSGVVEGVPGLLFWGRAPRSVPFLGGFHCVQPPTPRTAAQLAGSTGSPCSGAFSFDFNAYAQSGLNSALAPGQVIYAQYWYRDPADPLGLTAATSDAIAFPLGL